VSRRDFDVDEFLAGPLTARIATSGPSVRPMWYLWENDVFWVLTGAWSRLIDHVRTDPAVAVVVDVCDLATGLVRQVTARGIAEILPFDPPRVQRMLARYLGDTEECWDPRFRSYLHDEPDDKGTVWLRVSPNSLTAKDLSYVAVATD
jgi:nitroimidazol reductase NimA-like FMN-containing flavoprotein (pyridoxamine 5'-phosphate oxidase superfamily)